MIRSMLFLPGNSPKMLEKGPFLRADALIFDLEDAVAPDQKDAARDLLKYWPQPILARQRRWSVLIPWTAMISGN